MKTQKTTILLACAAIACAAVLAGCTKSTFGHGGEAVTFATTSSGSPATRTEYGDDATVNNVLKQALNWKAGDAITISSPQAVVQNTTDVHASNYKLTDITAGVPSTAKVQNESANGLMWLDEFDSYDFYGVYPKVGTTTPTLDKDGNVTATIVADQTVASAASKKYLKADGTATTAGATDIAYTYDVYAPDMSQAYMTAAATKVASGNTVKLSFEPAFTAFEINLTSADDDFSVSKVTLSAADGEYLAGGFAMKAGATAASRVTSGIQSVYFQPATAIAVTTAEGFTATLFTVPITNTGALTLQVQTQDGTATSTATLNLTNKDGSPYTFNAGHKYRINMLKIGGQWKATVIDLTFNVAPWTVVEVGTINTETGSINMSNVTWQNTKVKLTESGDEVNTVINSGYAVEMYYKPYVKSGDSYVQYTENNGHFPAQGYFTVNYPNAGLFKIGMIPAYGQTEVDPTAYAIYIYDNSITTGSKWRAIKTAGETITNNTVYFQVRAAKNDGAEYNGQIDIWFKASGENTEWVSAYSEIRANYNLHIPAHE